MFAQALVERGILDTITGAVNALWYNVESLIRSASVVQIVVAAAVIVVLWRLLRFR